MSRSNGSTITVALLMLFCDAVAASAQDASWDRWTVTIAAGTTFGGPVEAMANEFRSDGWDEVHDPAPRSDFLTYGYSWAAGIRYRFGPKFGSGFVYSSDPFPQASASNPFHPVGHVALNPKVRSAALLGAYHLREPRTFSVRLDAGPAIHWTTVRDEDADARLGALMGLGLSLHKGKFRLSIDGQHRLVGDVDYEYASSNGGTRRSAANFDYQVMLLGLGLTF